MPLLGEEDRKNLAEVRFIICNKNISHGGTVSKPA